MTVDVVEAWNGPGRHDGTLTTVLPEHNALHDRPDRSAFEHWYFDAHLDNGYTVVGFLVKRRPEDPPLARPWVEVIIYRPDGTRRQLAQRYPARAAHFSTDEVNVRIGPNAAQVIVDDGDLPRYRIVFDEDDVRLDLEFRNELAPWMPGRGETHFGDGGVFGWCVGAPRASVSGRMRLGDDDWDVTGRGYADHNWGIGAMPKVIEKWHWGRLYTEEYTLLYAVVATQERYGNLQIKPVMLAKRDDVLLSTGEVTFSEGATEYADVAGRTYPTSIALDCPGRFSLTLEVRQVLHAQALLEDIPIVGSTLMRPITDKLIGRPGYFRFRSDFTLSVVDQEDGSVDTVAGSTLHELVALR
ncbi:lipocalin-like domain-containing protein [Gordonia zhaorongruii]|uniref:lipocalin-like domain-containing protein n=1 Tax=Gordonia zhaorongruii TaxID=2597659 RepID=UPI00117E6A6B|nr:lipocalin-like domain-containing protein [Gordonia zhaorongruii]